MVRRIKRRFRSSSSSKKSVSSTKRKFDFALYNSYIKGGFHPADARYYASHKGDVRDMRFDKY